MVIIEWEAAYIILSGMILSSFSSCAKPLCACRKIIFLYSSKWNEEQTGQLTEKT